MIPNNNCWFSHDVIKIQYFVMKPSHLSPYIYMVNGTVTQGLILNHSQIFRLCIMSCKSWGVTV